MRWEKFLFVVTAVGLGVAVAAGGAYGGHLKKKDGVKAKIHKHVLTVTGTSDDDTITLGLAPGDPNTLQIDTGDHVIRFDRDQFDTIVVDARRRRRHGRHRRDQRRIHRHRGSTLNGEGGDDTLQGGSCNETLDGGDGNDLIDGNRGADIAFMGAGDDTFQWDPGDGSDVVEGQDGSDTMVFNGANVGRARSTSRRTAAGCASRATSAGITMDTDGVESVDVQRARRRRHRERERPLRDRREERHGRPRDPPVTAQPTGWS